MASLPTWFSSKGLPWQRGQRAEPQACHQPYQGDMGAQPECHTQNLRQDRLSDKKGHCHGPKGPRQKVSMSGMRDVQQSPPFRAPNDVVWYTIKEQLGIVAQHAINKETIGPLPILGGREVVPGSSKVAPSSIAVQGTKGGKKRRKRALRG
jgi:hypothetical protein